MGCVGWIAAPLSLQEFAGHVKQALDGIPLRLVGDPRRRVHRVALCSGSGGSLLGKAMASHCDVYVTGDLKYHEAKSALEAHLALIDIGHFASEKLILQPLVTYLRHRAASAGASLEVFPGQGNGIPSRLWGQNMIPWISDVSLPAPHAALAGGVWSGRDRQVGIHAPTLGCRIRRPKTILDGRDKLLEQLRHLVELQFLMDKKAGLIRSRDEAPLCIARTGGGICAI